MQLFFLKSIDKNIDYVLVFKEEVDEDELQKAIYDANNYYEEHEKDYWCQYECLYEKLSEKYSFEVYDGGNISTLYW